MSFLLAVWPFCQIYSHFLLIFVFFALLRRVKYWNYFVTSWCFYKSWMEGFDVWLSLCFEFHPQPCMLAYWWLGPCFGCWFWFCPQMSSNGTTQQIIVLYTNDLGTESNRIGLIQVSTDALFSSAIDLHWVYELFKTHTVTLVTVALADTFLITINKHPHTV